MIDQQETPKIYQNLKPENIEIELHNNAYSIESDTFYKQELTAEQLDEYKEILFKKTLEIFQKLDELKQHNKIQKDQIKELETLQHEAVNAIQNESILVNGNLYLFDDQQSGLMLAYDNRGYLIETRPLKPDQKQTSILTTMKTDSK